MDRFAGRTVADEVDGYALIAERSANHPRVGEQSPEIELPLHDGSGLFRLALHRGKRPVVLVFGSLT